MRIALINEGTYPLAHGGVSTWCHQLVTGLPEHAFTLVALSGLAATGGSAYELPGNVSAVHNVAVWDRPVPVRGWRARHRHRRAAQEAAALLFAGMVGDGEAGAEQFGTGLRRLTALAESGAHPLYEVPIGGVLREVWNTGRRNAGDVRLPLPRLSRQNALDAANLIEHATRALSHQLPPVDICHPVAAGLPMLMALAAKWRNDTPFLLTEHGVYLRERYLEVHPRMPHAVKAVTMRFYRSLVQLGYAQAGLVTSVSRFNQRWELKLGADPLRTLVVPNGVDPLAYPPILTEPDAPTIVWVGRIDPLKDLHTMIKAFGMVHQAMPAARLKLFGPVPATNQAYAETCYELVRSLRLTDVVEFCGPVAGSRVAYEAGQVVALSSISEGMPYTVVEAMMCGRATVNTDVGGVADTVGDAGLVTPPNDPHAFAQACLSLLGNDARRHAMGEAARRRALDQFALDRMLGTYDALYTDLHAGRPGVRLPEVDQPPAGTVVRRRVRVPNQRRFAPKQSAMVG